MAQYPHTALILVLGDMIIRSLLPFPSNLAFGIYRCAVPTRSRNYDSQILRPDLLTASRLKTDLDQHTEVELVITSFSAKAHDHLTLVFRSLHRSQLFGVRFAFNDLFLLDVITGGFLAWSTVVGRSLPAIADYCRPSRLGAQY